MSLLRDSTGLVVLSSAVLFGIFVLGATSLLRAAPRRGAVARRIIAEAAAKAPTDAHMTLIVAGKMLRQLVRKWTS
jgi:hypothetical protein